jgi:hypothetical protein
MIVFGVPSKWRTRTTLESLSHGPKAMLTVSDRALHCCPVTFNTLKEMFCITKDHEMGIIWAPLYQITLKDLSRMALNHLPSTNSGNLLSNAREGNQIGQEPTSTKGHKKALRSVYVGQNRLYIVICHVVPSSSRSTLRGSTLAESSWNAGSTIFFRRQSFVAKI